MSIPSFGSYDVGPLNSIDTINTTQVFNKEASCAALLKHCDKTTCVAYGLDWADRQLDWIGPDRIGLIK